MKISDISEIEDLIRIFKYRSGYLKRQYKHLEILVDKHPVLTKPVNKDQEMIIKLEIGIRKSAAEILWTIRHTEPELDYYLNQLAVFNSTTSITLATNLYTDLEIHGSQLISSFETIQGYECESYEEESSYIFEQYEGEFIDAEWFLSTIWEMSSDCVYRTQQLILKYRKRLQMMGVGLGVKKNWLATEYDNPKRQLQMRYNKKDDIQTFIQAFKNRKHYIKVKGMLNSLNLKEKNDFGKSPVRIIHALFIVLKKTGYLRSSCHVREKFAKVFEEEYFWFSDRPLSEESSNSPITLDYIQKFTAHLELEATE